VQLSSARRPERLLSFQLRDKATIPAGLLADGQHSEPPNLPGLTVTANSDLAFWGRYAGNWHSAALTLTARS
jgi:hypothetical protein